VPRFSFAILLAAAVLVSAPELAQAQLSPETLGVQLNRLGQQLGGCTAARHRIRSVRNQVEGYHFAFAGRKAATFTGIRGCGWAWNKDKAKAEAAAMRHCKEWEVKYGTGGGGKTCRIMD